MAGCRLLAGTLQASYFVWHYDMVVCCLSAQQVWFACGAVLVYYCTIFSAASCVKLYSRPLRSPPAPRASPAVWHMSVT